MKTKKGFTLVELLVVISIIAVLLAVLIPSMNKARATARRVICGNQLKQTGVGMAAYASAYDSKMPWSGGVTSGMPDDAKDESTLHPFLIWRTDHSLDTDWLDMTAKCVCGQMGKARPMRLACLFAGKFIQDGKVFYCPGNTDPARRYESYCESVEVPPNYDWGRPHQLYSKEHSKNRGWIRSGYDYYPIDKAIIHRTPYAGMKDVAGKKVPKVTCRKFTQLRPNAPYVTDIIWQKSDIVHKTGLKINPADPSPNGEVVINGGINALFGDGHASFVRDGKVQTRLNPQGTYNETLFSNRAWAYWRVQGAEPPPGIKPEVFYYNMFDAIGESGL
ncbi:MAG: type II secretion system protein [Phycisphaerae bacterium]|nr:type II secretion system protein [Phycisphaerae bacterium]